MVLVLEDRLSFEATNDGNPSEDGRDIGQHRRLGFVVELSGFEHSSVHADVEKSKDCDDDDDNDDKQGVDQADHENLRQAKQ